MAQSSPAGVDQTRLNQQLLKRIDELEASQATLQRKLDQLVVVAPAVAPIADGPAVSVAVPSPVTAAEPSVPDMAPSSPPVELSGYFSSNFFRQNMPGNSGNYNANTASFFIGKTLGRWRFHSEVEFQYQPEVEKTGVALSHVIGKIGLETGWMNYSHADWLNGRAGRLFVPTYWRVHHYPSITLTVNAPLIDERIFPPSFYGGMIHGAKFFERSGLEYALYAGRGEETDGTHVNRQATGGKFLVHVPNGNKLQTLALGFQWHREKGSGDDRDLTYGFEARLEKGPLSFLGEFAHSNIGSDHGVRTYFKEGYYLQPSLHLWRKSKSDLIYRYDQLNDDNRSPDERVGRHTFGMRYSPISTASIKLEFNRYSPVGDVRAYYGFAAGVAFFFRTDTQ